MVKIIDDIRRENNIKAIKNNTQMKRIVSKIDYEDSKGVANISLSVDQLKSSFNLD